MSLFLAKEDMKVIDGHFLKKEHRLLAYELMNFDHNPVKSEMHDLVRKYEIDTKAFHRVLDALRKKQLFTEAEGSIPLYRKKLKEKKDLDHVDPLNQLPAHERTLEDEKALKKPAGTPPTEIKPEVHIQESPFKGSEGPKGHEGDDLSGASKVVSDDVKVQVSGISTRLDGLEKNMGDIKEFMAQITTKLTVNPMTQSTPPAASNPSPKAQEATVVASGSLQGTISDNPLEKYTREELMELIMNQASEAQNPSTPSPQLGVRTVEVPQAMVRKMIVEVTPLTQILYIQALKDEAFKGSFSDYINQIIQKFYHDRDLAWGFNKFTPVG